jgi:hypothetical protein
MKPRQKWTNERTFEYDISVAFPFSAVTICKPQQKWANQWACSGVRVTNTRTVGAHLSRSTFVSRSVTHVFVNIYICDKLEMRQMCSTHNRKGTQSTFVSHISINFLKGNNYAHLHTGYQPLFCVFCIYRTVFRSLPVSKKNFLTLHRSHILNLRISLFCMSQWKFLQVQHPEPKHLCSKYILTVNNCDIFIFNAFFKVL